MGAALHASMPSMAAALRRVLGPLHDAKSAPGVDTLLLRLYQPILFRALAAANPAVRRNALGLLVDAFPLQVCQLSSSGIVQHVNEIPWSWFGKINENLFLILQPPCHTSRPDCVACM